MIATDIYENCFTQVWPRIKQLYNDKEVELILEHGKGCDVELECDLELVSRALDIVLRNALTQTLRGTDVKVVYGSVDSNFVLVVRDNGPGMEESQFNDLYSTGKLQEFGINCKVKSKKFDEFPNGHGTSITIVFKPEN